MQNWKIELSDAEALSHAAGQRIYREILLIEQDLSSPQRIQWLCEVIEVLTQLDVKPEIWRSQNVFYLLTKGHRKGLLEFINAEWRDAFEHLAELLKTRLT